MNKMSNKNKSRMPWVLKMGIPIFILAFFTIVQPVFADIFPKYLKNGRTYDQESEYIQWSGTVGYVRLYHRDNTSLPSSEGGGSCSRGCYEYVTRIYNGGTVSGNFTYLQTFNVQLATSGASGVGTAVIKACGKTIRTINMYQAGAGTPGFNNIPSPAWNVPTAGNCTWSITATGGYVDFRAVTTTFRSTPAPTVDIKVNGTDGPLNLFPMANYSLSWTSTNAAACSASGNWSGEQATNGSQLFTNIISGSYTYTITCTNPSGSASDHVTINVAGNPPVVDLKVNGSDGPLSLDSPADYTLNWTSQDAVSCTATSSDNGWVGSVALSGNQILNGMDAGTYNYTITCSNLYETISDTVTVVVIAPLRGTISITYARLLLFASNLGQPAQTLTGMATGGVPPYSVDIRVRTPSGNTVSFNRGGATWAVTPENSGDLNFGTTEEGIWTAWAELQDSTGQTYQTGSSIWEVAWHPVHGRP